MLFVPDYNYRKPVVQVAAIFGVVRTLLSRMIIPITHVE